MKNQHKLYHLLLAVLLPLLVGFTTFNDPTKPPGADAVPVTYNPGQPLQLTAIFIHAHNRFAIISGQSVKIGDHLGEYIVTSITPYTVELLGSKKQVDVLQLTTPVKQETKFKGL